MSKSLKTYLKYSIGEVLLVVIGILIALQINTWNDNRKENIKLKSYFGKIHDEVHSPTIIIYGNDGSLTLIDSNKNELIEYTPAE